MLWSFFHLDNMDEKEQADRMAAAEALYMISTRGDKGGAVQKSPRRGRKKKNNDFIEDINAKRKNENGGDVTVNSSRARSKKNVRGSGGGRGGRGRGGTTNPRGRGGAAKSTNTAKRQQRQHVDDFNNETFQRNNNGHVQQLKRSSTGGEKMLPDLAENSKHKSTRTAKTKNNRTKSNSPSNDEYSYVTEADDSKCHQAIGFTGAAISISSDFSNRRSSVDASQNLQSQSLASGFRQIGFTSRTLSSTATMLGLPSMNLASFTPDLNLPSIPLEIGSLQLSSQPTPNLSSLGDMGEGVYEDDFTSAERKSEKFLPLKKRKLHNPSEAEVREPTPSMETASFSDSEERSEQQSPPPPLVEPIRATFTVQAPPIITMKTLMEIKTALTADDDGDLPLHIAVVHENMRMVIKLINLMRIAGKGVDKFNKQQQTPLHLAVKLNFLEAIDILLKSNANVNAVDCTGSSCIHMAVQGRSANCLTMLLDKCPHADLNVRNFDGLTPLHIAVDNGDLQQVETLLQYNADIDVTDGKSGRTALFRAAESNQKAMVEMLLSKGANPDVPNYAGVTTAMAAQGRNLHGVLKLLGSVATDKFTDYETKPSGLTLESKPTPVYLGFPTSDNMVFSQNNPSRGGNLPKHTSPEITCMIEPKVNTEAAEVPSNEIKVFHNVFVLSQSQSKEKSTQAKSASEPSSPEVKMEVVEDKDVETFGRSGLMSLPEGIFCHSEENRGDKLLLRQREATTVIQGGSLFSSQAKLHVPVCDSKVIKNTGLVTPRDEHKKPLVFQIVPPPKSVTASAALVSMLTSSQKAMASDILSKSSGVSSKPVSAATTATSSSSSPLPNLPSSTTDTVTLTGMQARLFQMLLKMYNIDPANEVTTSSSSSRLVSSSSSVLPKLSLPQSSSLSLLTTSPSVTSLAQKQGAVTHSFTHHNSSNAGELSVVNNGDGTDSDRSSHNLTQPQHKSLGSLRISYEHDLENGARMDEKPEESPLNLSTTSNRQDNPDTGVRDSIDNPGGMSRSGYSTLSSDDGTSMVTQVKPGLSPIPFGPKVISFGVRRISDGDKVGRMSSEGSGQFEMFLLPASEQIQIPATTASGQFEPTSFTTLSTTRSNIYQEKSAAKFLEHKHAGEIIHAPDFHHITTSVSQKTASIVRDYLSQQSQMRCHSNSSPQLLTASAPASPLQATVPTVLDLAAETTSSTQNKHVITLAKNPSTVVSMGKTVPKIESPVSSTILFPAVSTSPVFLHQGQVIDLSRGKVTEGNRLSSQTFSLLNPGPAQQKIIGFSGAVLSVVPPKIDRPEKRIPKEIPSKEIQKKRGRKSQKSLPGFSLAADMGLGKINSETDEKLKRFLGAKKLENAFSLLPNAMEEALGLQNEQTSDGMEENEALGTHSESGLSESHADKTYKTVGIFSGNIQHVKVGKKSITLSSPLTSFCTPLSVPVSLSLALSSAVPSGGLFTGISQGNICNAANNSTLSTVVSPSFFVATDVADKSYSRQFSLETDSKDSSDGSNEIINIYRSNFSNENSDEMSKNVASGSLSSNSALTVPKKSKRKSTKSLLSIVEENKERITPVVKKKEGSLQSGISEKKSDNNGSFVSCGVQKIKSSKTNKKTSTVRNQRQKGKGNSSSGQLEMMKSEERISGDSDSMQAFLPDSDTFKKQKHQRKKKSGSTREEQIPSYVPGNTNEQHPSENKKLFFLAGVDHNLEVKVKDTGKVDKQTEFSAENTEISNMELDDDNEDATPTLVIEESEEMD